MHIGLVVPGFSASESDWCIPALASYVRRLAERHEVRVLALRYPHRNETYEAFGARVRALGGAETRGLRKVPLLARALLTLRREHSGRPFDVLHGFWADEPGFVAARTARRLGIPSVVTLLGGELVSIPEIGYGGQRSFLNRGLVARALREADRVTAGSRYLETLAAPHVTACRIPIGADDERFRPGPGEGDLLDGAPKLLHVASLVPVKGQETLLRAFAAVRRRRPGAVLHIVGDGPLRQKLEGHAVEGVRYHGAVPHDQLPRYYRSADLCVMSSRHEGQEWVTQEAALCARATAGTGVGVVPDLAPRLAVPVGSSEALAKVVLDTVSTSHGTRVFGRKVREEALKRFSLARTVSALEALYAELRETRYRRSTSLSKSRSATASMENPA